MKNNIIDLLYALVNNFSLYFIPYDNKSRDIIYKNNFKIYKGTNGSNPFSYGILQRKSVDEILSLNKGNDLPICLKEIFDEFIDYVDPVNLEYCFKNINSLNIKNKHTLWEHLSNFFSSSFATGSYSPYYNKMELFTKNKSTISHEFLHMASSANGFPNFCGFSSYKREPEKKTIYKFGEGLNEGYTELLNNRIFGYKNYSTYINNVKIAKLIECFFDNYRDMEYAYFHTDIGAVYNAFCKYGTKEEFYIVMNNLDYFADAPMVSDCILSLKTQMLLYKIIKRSKDADKIKKFEDILNDNLHGVFGKFKEHDSSPKHLKLEFKKAGIY